MSLKNIVEFNTVAGHKTVELHQADFTKWDYNFDLLVISSHLNDYEPAKRSLIGALKKQGVDIMHESLNPRLDFRGSLNVWLTQKQTKQNFTWVCCVESDRDDVLNPEEKLSEIFKNLFSFLAMLPYCGIKINSIAMPILGAGLQKMEPSITIPIMMRYFRIALEDNLNLSQIFLVERSNEKVSILDLGMESYLKKEFKLVNIPSLKLEVKLIKELRKKLKYLINENPAKYKHNQTVTTLDIRLKSNEFRIHEVGILCRRLAELIVVEFLTSYEVANTSTLNQKINKLRQKNISNWIIDYFRVVKDLGNFTAHQVDMTKTPNEINENDVRAMIVSVNCLLDFVIQTKYMSN